MKQEKGTGLLTLHDQDLVLQLRQIRERYVAEGREHRDKMHEKFALARGLSDRIIAEKFECSKSTIQKVYR